MGCLEAVAGARAVETKIRQAIAEGTSLALELAGGAQKDPVSGPCWRRRGWVTRSPATSWRRSARLGLGLANLVNLFNPGAVILDRRLELAGPELLHQVVGVVKRQALTYSAANAVFSFAQLGREAGVLGVR